MYQCRAALCHWIHNLNQSVSHCCKEQKEGTTVSQLQCCPLNAKPFFSLTWVHMTHLLFFCESFNKLSQSPSGEIHMRTQAPPTPYWITPLKHCCFDFSLFLKSVICSFYEPQGRAAVRKSTIAWFTAQLFDWGGGGRRSPVERRNQRNSGFSHRTNGAINVTYLPKCS